jgi:zinc transporter, ZIP family
VSSPVVAVLLLSLLSCLTTCIGVALALTLRESARAIAAGIGFSTGLMVLLSVLELLPEAAAVTGVGRALALAALGAALVYSLHHVIPHVHMVEERAKGVGAAPRAAFLVAFGLILHDVPEGFAIASAYVAAPTIGVVTALAVALHNLPEQFAMALPAVALGRRRVLFGVALLSALAEPVGAVAGLAAVGIAPGLNVWFLSLAAGAMLFVSIHELVPMARRYDHGRMFAAGVVLGALVYWLLTGLAAAVPPPLGPGVAGDG